MKILEVNQIRRDDNFIYYRRNFLADAKIELLSKTVDASISFTIETGPLGNKLIYVEFAKGTDIDYPLIPVKAALKNFILTLDEEGKLP